MNSTWRLLKRSEERAALYVPVNRQEIWTLILQLLGFIYKNRSLFWFIFHSLMFLLHSRDYQSTSYWLICLLDDGRCGMDGYIWICFVCLTNLCQMETHIRLRVYCWQMNFHQERKKYFIFSNEFKQKVTNLVLNCDTEPPGSLMIVFLWMDYVKIISEKPQVTACMAILTHKNN